MAGNGSVRRTPAGLLCPKRCTVSFSLGETVTLFATPRKKAWLSQAAGNCAKEVPTPASSLSTQPDPPAPNVPQALASPVSSAAPVGALTSMGWKCGNRRPSIRDLAWASQKEAKPGRGHAGGTVHTRPLVGVQAVVPEVSLGKTCLRFASAGQFFACGLSARTGCRERTQRWRRLPNC